MLTAEVTEPRIVYSLPKGLEIGPKPGQGPEIYFWLKIANEEGRSTAERMSAFMALLNMGVSVEVVERG